MRKEKKSEKRALMMEGWLRGSRGPQAGVPEMGDVVSVLGRMMRESQANERVGMEMEESRMSGIVNKGAGVVSRDHAQLTKPDL